jgi:hypothetical protein
MKIKFVYVFLVICVSALMLMPNIFAAIGPPIVWAGQTTLSPADGVTSQDPENSGFGTTQVTVWEEWNGADWDIMMSVSINDGALWSPPIIVVATPGVDEINPAVAVTNFNPAGFQEVHVVYQCASLIWPGTWDVCHVYTINFGAVWIGPVILDFMFLMDAIDPAVVYTEDLSPAPGGGGVPGMLVQFVWAEWNAVVLPQRYEIYYNAFYFDPILGGTGYVGSTLIRTCPFGDCMYPEIASVDETLNAAAYDYYFAVVWEEPTAAGQINVWYVDGTTTTSPVMGIVLTPGSMGQLNAPGLPGNCYHPDIAATQDYYFAGPVETYYFHVNWVYRTGGPITYQIDTCYSAGAAPTPGAASFIATLPAVGALITVLDNPTIATKLVALAPVLTFETWMCWEDNSVPLSAPDIWYRVGQYTTLPPAFGYIVGAALVPYMPPGGFTEYNPELWNRNDSTRTFPPPPFTHLVFDMPQFGAQEVEYIDP